MKQPLPKNNDTLFAGANSKQIEAITHEHGPVMSLAGPGSGKTFVLTQHIRYLILEKHINPFHILVITFSKASAIEMQKRFNELMGQEYYPVRFGTFHSIFFNILIQYENYKTSDILTYSQKIKFLKSVLLQMKHPCKMDIETLENILNHISYIKNHTSKLILETEKIIPHFSEIYHDYERLIRREHKLDFDDMMLLCHQLLIDRPQIVVDYKQQVEYVLIDEYQDINPIQNDLVIKLVEPHNNLFVVGDDDQSIYGFRGCTPGIMLDFKKQFPDGKIITFPVNYRCNKDIVDTANQIISHNTHRYEKRITAHKEISGSVSFRAFNCKESEYEKIVFELKELYKKSSLILDHTACLFRTNPDASYLAELLSKEKIPFQIKEKPYNIYDHFISRDFLHYLKLGSGIINIEDFIPIMNRPLRYISRDAINACNKELDFNALKQFYTGKEYMIEKINKLEYDLKRMKDMDVFASINYIRKGIGYDEFLKKYALENNGALDDLIKMTDEIQFRMGKYVFLEELEDHIEQYREESIQKLKESKQKSGVHIMTYHAAKGLEFDRVYLLDCNEGIIPYKKSITEEQIEEERRLFYVAVTRAKEKLAIWYLDGGKENHHMVSRFVKEAKK